MEVSNIIKGLYAITPDQNDNDQLISQVEQAINGGVKVIQYRAKTINITQKKIQARAIKDLCDKRNIKLIINDNIELSLHLDAFGVHLGKDDDNIDKARKILGPNKCIGVSCYNSVARAKAAHEKKVNYIALGAFFPTSSKPNAPRASLEQIKQVREFCELPIVAIGGITLDNISMLLKNDINAIASISSIFNARNIKNATQQFCKILERKSYG